MQANTINRCGWLTDRGLDEFEKCSSVTRRRTQVKFMSECNGVIQQNTYIHMAT